VISHRVKILFASLLIIFSLLSLLLVLSGCKKSETKTSISTSTGPSGSIAKTQISLTSSEESSVNATITKETETVLNQDQIMNPIRIGGSVIGKYGITKEYSTANEVRVVQNNKHIYAEEKTDDRIISGKDCSP